MVRSKSTKRRMKTYKKSYVPYYPLNNGASCVRYCRTVAAVTWNVTQNIEGELSHVANLPNNPEYIQASALYRTAEILKASCVFMPCGPLANSSAVLGTAGPVVIAPNYGDYTGNLFSYSRLAPMPGAVLTSSCDLGTKRRAYWYKKDKLPFDTTSLVAGRCLDETYGGFLIFIDGGAGFVQGNIAGYVVLTWKILFKDPKHLA